MNIKKMIISMIILFFTGSSLYAEFIFLTDGAIIEGEIVSEESASITVRNKENKKLQIKRNTILRILYTELKMGKIYIQKRDGKGIVAYMVNEDRNSYTFRMDLYKPEEFVLKRSEVLFISEKNPSGLMVDGEPGTDRVSLAWQPPYDAVKNYNIYIKESEKAEYALIEKTKSKELTLKNLKSNKVYFIMVTSVDASDYESTPSNELKITTANIRPGRPRNVKVDENSNDGKSGNVLKFWWDDALDPDGKIDKYKIYGRKDKTWEPLAEVKGKEYSVKNADSYNSIKLTAVDDKGDESDDVKIKDNKSFYGAFSPGIIIPLGVFSEMAEMGYGGSFSFSLSDNTSINYFEAGLSLGCYYLPGKDVMDVKGLSFNRFLIVPLYINAGYNFSIGSMFSIKPEVSLGGAYINLNYKNAADEGISEETKNIFDLSGKAGISIRFAFTNSLSLTTGCEYGGFIEKSGILSFLQANAGIKYSF
ncbi:MAG: fibronectin type III domain-containing protein [Spirochaetes bacterium]|nr:fibronectin type III domain-containing protein [Spirochaetota bacterium]